eukprot:scaffold234121_cov30-Cyclotella_meneghiniana.AAC.2
MSHTNKLRYCERYRAKCILPTARVDGNSKVHKKWDKLYYINHTLITQEVDWVLWMDCDAAFTNYEINWYTHLKTYLNTSQLMVVAKDFNGINLGVFLVTNTQVSRTLIEDMYKQRFAIDKDRKFLFKDQSALKQLIKKNSSIESSIEIVPSKLMNTYPNAWVPNDWIMHQVNCNDLRICLANFKRVMKMVTPPYSTHIKDEVDHGQGIIKGKQNTKMIKKESLHLKAEKQIEAARKRREQQQKQRQELEEAARQRREQQQKQRQEREEAARQRREQPQKQRQEQEEAARQKREQQQIDAVFPEAQLEEASLILLRG